MEHARKPMLVWAAAVAVAALATWVMFDAHPGINWVMWTGAAAAGLFLFAREGVTPTLLVTGGLATIIAGGAAVTANEMLLFFIVIAVICFMALHMLLSNDARWSRITAGLAVPAPIVAFGNAIVEAARRALDALNLVRSDRARAVVRGLSITIPVIFVFTLLLASADPVFASFRDAVERLLESWDFIPRTIFFLAALTMTLGAYGFADRGEAPVSLITDAPVTRRRWLGSTERLILLSSVTALFWIFLAVQLSYLFGNLPRVTGSGMTFSEYARRGFGEITVVASASAALILLSERFGKKDEREKILRIITLALLLAVLFLLGSAFHRVSLYEEAYGFTTSRLYAQVYMLVAAVSLFLLALEVLGDIRQGRLFRGVALTATAAFIVLIYWNHEAWIASKNIDRFYTTGKLDIEYLTDELSANAIPTLVQRSQTMPEPVRTVLTMAVQKRYARRARFFEREWYEWNYSVERARAALEQSQLRKSQI